MLVQSRVWPCRAFRPSGVCVPRFLPLCGHRSRALPCPSPRWDVVGCQLLVLLPRHSFGHALSAKDRAPSVTAPFPRRGGSSCTINLTFTARCRSSVVFLRACVLVRCLAVRAGGESVSVHGTQSRWTLQT